MSRKSRRKKSVLKSRFYQIYFAVVALALIAIAVGTVWLRGLLKDYESAQPVYVAEDVAKLFESGDYDRIYDLDTSAAQISGGDKAFYLDSMAQITAGKAVEWTETFSAKEDERRYSVTLDGEKFASFSLVPSGQVTKKGNRLWTLGDVTTYVALREPEPVETPEPEAPTEYYECRVTVPTGYQVTVDGEPVSGENAQVTPGFLFEEGFLPEGVENPMTTTYVFSTPSESPAIAATDENGEPAQLTASADRERAWSCGPKEDAAMSMQYADAAYALGQQIAKFMSKDGSKRSITKLCLKNSPAWDIFDNLSNRFATPHKGIDFRNRAVTEFYKLSDTCFTCHVSFDYVLNTTDGERVYPTAYTFCLVNQDGKGGLYNLQIY